MPTALQHTAVSTKTLTLCAAAALSALLSGCAVSGASSVTTPSEQRGGSGLGTLSSAARRDIALGYDDTLTRLYETTPGSRELVSKAAGVLIFPRAVAAGLVVGGEYGTGELRVNNRFDGYYKTTSASFGLQVGAQSRALVFVFMTQDALNKFRDSKGWSVGADASVAVLKTGVNGTIDANAARAPTVAFVMSNAGLMANLTLEGTKVTRVE